MSKSIIQIPILSFCGSSLVNILFDAMEGYRGLGEIRGIHNVVECNRCDGQCHFYDGVATDSFYSYCFDLYPDTNIICDASKNIDRCPSLRSFEPQFDYFVVSVLKLPHEFVYSAIGHRSESPRYFLDVWLKLARQSMADSVGLPFYIINYRELASRPFEIMTECCAAIGLPITEFRTHLWSTDTHIINGNTSIQSQVKGDQSFFEHDNKYHGRFRQIFVDSAWCADTRFIRDMEELFVQRRAELSDVLATLGMGTFDGLMCDLLE